MRDFIIRLATKKDLEGINRFGTPVVKAMDFYNKEHTAANVYEMSVKYLKGELKESKDPLIIAVTNDGRAVGLVAHYPGHGHVDWLDWILVDKDFRKMGLGRAMLNYAMKDAKRRGCHKIWTDIHPKNLASIKFHKRMGFRKVGVLKRHGFKEDDTLWERQIR